MCTLWKVATMSGGQAVVEALKAEGVEVIFSLPGRHTLSIYDALVDTPEIRNIVVRHEQGAAFMADGYARSTGKVGACLVTAGPGAANTMAAMGTAYTDSIPVLNITSEISSHLLGKQRGVIHEFKDQSSMFATVTDWSRRVTSVGEIPEAIHEAMRVLKMGRPRPVVIEIPVDVLDAKGEAQIQAAEEYEKPGPSPQQATELARRLVEARLPVLWVGGGVISSEATAELLQLAELLQAPVFTTNMGKGAFPGDHPLCLGFYIPHPLVREFVAKADLLLAIGTRFTGLATADWSMKFPPNLIHIDIDPSEIGRSYAPSMRIVSDAKKALTAILEELWCMGVERRPSRRPEIQAVKRAVVKKSRELGREEVKVVEIIQKALPRDAIVSCDCSVGTQWMRLLLEMFEPRTWLFPASSQTLGYGYPAAVGAKVGRPDRPVLSICGDGGFMMTGNELATAVKYGINFPVLIFNDESYGTVAKLQQKQFPGRRYGVELHNPDFMLVARAFGAKGYRVESPSTLERVLCQALRLQHPAIIEFRFDFRYP